MNTKEQIEQCIKSLEWLKFNIVGTEEPKKNTFEYATKVYLENAVALLKDQESDEVLDIIIKKGVNVGYAKHRFKYNNLSYREYVAEQKTSYLDIYVSKDILNETEFNLIKEWLKNGD